MTDRTLRIRGVEPIQKGSFTPMKIAGRCRCIEGGTGARRKELAEWRKAVELEAERVADRFGLLPLDGPISVRIVFWLPRPKSSRFGAYPAGRPDLDKLVRALLDGLGALIRDDARVVNLHAFKRWAQTDEDLGADVVIRPAAEHDRPQRRDTQ